MAKMKPALFNTEMVRAMLIGDKSATRRVIRPQPKMQLSYIMGGHNHGKWTYPPPHCVEQSRWPEKYRRIDALTEDDLERYWTPPCCADDVLYVREAFANCSDLLGGKPGITYRADYSDTELRELRKRNFRWSPPLHMPKEAARLFCLVTSVAVERLQDITENGAFAEGAYHGPLLEGGDFCLSAIDSFRDIWNGTILKKDMELYGWNANPWVWVIEYKMISKREAYKREADV